MNAARKAQDKDRTLVLGTILANLKNREIELDRAAADDEVVEVVRKGIKLRREAVGAVSARPAGPSWPAPRKRRSRSWRSSFRPRSIPRRSGPRCAR